MSNADTHPLPSSGYGELCKIIQGYAEIGGPATLKDVGVRVGMAETTVSGNNKFLVACGIIEGGQQKAITPSGVSLARALQYEQNDGITRGWQAAISKNELLEKVLSAIRIRKGMDESALETHIAYTAGQKKAPRIMTGARTVVEILRAAGAVEEQGDKLVATKWEPGSAPSTEITPEDETWPASFESPPAEPSARVSGSMASGYDQARYGGIVLHVNLDISVECSIDELEGLGPRIKALIRDLEQRADSEDAPATDA